MGRPARSGAAMLQKIRSQLNAACQDSQEQNHDNCEPETGDACSPQSNGDNSLMGQKSKSAGVAMLQKQRGGQPNVVPQDLREQNSDNREPETEDSSSPQINVISSLRGRKRKTAGAARLQMLREQLNAVRQDLQEKNYDNIEPETEDASPPQSKGVDSAVARKLRPRTGMLQELRGQPNAVPQDLPDRNSDNSEPETGGASSAQCSGVDSTVGQKFKRPRTGMLHVLRGQPNAVPQDLPERNYENGEPETRDASSPQSYGVDSLVGPKVKRPRTGKLQMPRGQPSAVPQDLPERNYDNSEPETRDASSHQSNGDNSLMAQKWKSAGAAVLQKQRGQPNVVPQAMQEQNYDNREPKTEDASSPRINAINSLMGGVEEPHQSISNLVVKLYCGDRKRKTAGVVKLQKFKGPLSAVPQDKNYDNREPETEDASSPQSDDDNSLMGQKCKSAGAATLQNKRGQPNIVPQDLQEQNNDNREPETEDAPSPQINVTNSLMGRKRKTAGTGMLQKFRAQLNAVPQDLQEKNYDNRGPETEDASPQSNGVDSVVGRKFKRARTPSGQPNAVPQDFPEKISDVREPETEDASPQSNDDNVFASSSHINAMQQKKCDLLLVNIMDMETKETTIRKMHVSQIWNLEKKLKVVVELNGNGQGHDNGTNLLVRFLGKLSKNPTLCPIAIKSWPKMPEDKSREQWKYIEGNFLFDYAAGCKWVMSSLREKWKAHKYKLRRKYFDPNKTKQEVIDNPPPEVDIADWTAFVEYYFDNDMKKKCQQNCLNRGKLKVPHAGGSRSNARKSRQMAEELGRPVCRSEVLLSNIVREDGTCVNEEGRKLAEEISKYLPQDQERAAAAGVSLTMLASPYDAIGKVFGAEHPGHVRVVGAGVSASSVFGLQEQLNRLRMTSFLGDAIEARLRGMGAGFSPSDVSGSIEQLNLPSSFISDALEEKFVGLVKQVETLQEKVNGYDEMKEKFGDLVKVVEILQEKVNGYDEMKTQLAQTRVELRETKTKLLRNQVQMGGLYKFLEDNFS